MNFRSVLKSAVSTVILAGLTLVANISSSQSVASLHLTLGNPSNASLSSSVYWNYLMQKNQYAIGYSRYDGVPKWVSWHLGRVDLGNSGRTSSFSPETSLPTGWYRPIPTDYSGTGFDRGHNCPSGDRTATETDNRATFLMSNIFPQAPDNNQGPWAILEDYCRQQVLLGKELYIMTTWSGSHATIANGRVKVPSWLHKIIVVLPEGSNDLSRINSATRVIAISMPNVQGIRNNNWKNYRVTVDSIETVTGYNFLSNVSADIQAVLESRVDNL